MNIKIADVMTERVMTTTRHQTFGHIKKVLHKHKASCLPVVDSDGAAVGIVTSSDMLADRADGVSVSAFMTPHVHCVPQYNDVSVAARVMRKHKIHHVVVTHEKKVVGIVSSFDLLQLVEGRRFSAKSPPTPQS